MPSGDGSLINQETRVSADGKGKPDAKLQDSFLSDLKAAMSIMHKQHKGPSPELTKAAGSVASQDARVSGPNQSCAAADIYKHAIDLTARIIFDVDSFRGNIKSLNSKFDCDKVEDPRVRATNEIQKVTGDKRDLIMDPAAYNDFMDKLRGRATTTGITVIPFSVDLSGRPVFPRHSDNPNSEDDRDDPSKRVGIIGVTPNTAAAEAGLKPGDLIFKVGNIDTSKMDSVAVKALLNGTPDTKVQVTVSRDGQLITKELIRKTIDVPTVDEPQNLDGIIRIKINSFNENTSSEVQQAVEKYPTAKGYIIDIRDNPGGLVPAAEGVAEMFVEKGGIWRDEEREDSDPESPVFLSQYLWVDEQMAHRDRKFSTANEPEPSEIEARAKYLAGHKPVVLIVNGNSASASEILTGALGDSGIVVVGSGGDPAKKENVGTFGKGTGQMIFPDATYGGAVKATELHYKTPMGTWPGNSFDKRYGLRPDIVVNNPDGVEPGAPNDAQLAAALSEINSQLKGVKHKTVYQ